MSSYKKNKKAYERGLDDGIRGLSRVNPYDNFGGKQALRENWLAGYNEGYKAFLQLEINCK